MWKDEGTCRYINILVVGGSSDGSRGSCYIVIAILITVVKIYHYVIEKDNSNGVPHWE